MIKAITFDLDGVYFTAESYPNFKAKIPKLTSDMALVDQVLSQSEEMMKFKRGEMDEETFWNYVRSTLQVSISNPTIYQYLADSYQMNPDVVSFVEKVRSHGIKTCICTNNFITRIRELNKRYGFLSNFDVHVFSYSVGATKPDPIIYQALIKYTNCLPEEIVIADDKIANVEAAKALGINAFQYVGFDSFIAELKNLGVEV
jgi:putative hydrolase of the HAD superfamily